MSPSVGAGTLATAPAQAAEEAGERPDSPLPALRLRRMRTPPMDSTAMTDFDEMRGLFRFGFIAYAAADEPRGDSTWKVIIASWHRITIGGYRCRWHPEVALRVLPHDDGAIVIVGDIFAAGGRSVDEALAPIRCAPGTPSGLESLESLDDLSGRFALLLITPAGLVALHDAFGARSLFYKTDGAFALSSHAQLLAHALGIRRRADIALLLQSPLYLNRAVMYLPGNATVYEQVSALIPNHALHSSTRTQARDWPTARRSAGNLEAFTDCFLQYLHALTAFIRTSGRVPVVGITGGIDSRLLIAGLAADGIDFRGVTWRGNYLQDSESDAVEAVWRGLNMTPVDLDPARFKPGAIARTGSRNAGNYRKASRLTEGMHRLFGGLPRAVFIRGYGGEILRGFYNVSGEPMAALTVPEMCRRYGYGAGLSAGAQAGRSPRSIVLACFDDYHAAAGFDGIDALGYDPNDLFYWEHRMGMWGSAMLNEMDAALYSIAGFNSRRLFAHAFGLPDAQRLTKNLLRTMVHQLQPWLARLPST